MEDEVTAETMVKKACIASTLPSVPFLLEPGKAGDCSNNQDLLTKQTNHPVALTLEMCTESPKKTSYASRKITASLENESVWSRFHSLGTEMILTKQGRRMFPCCRLRLGGLDPCKKYALLMDFLPLDAFTHKWNGKTWEPAAECQPLILGRVCVHPESPALGQQWMESPVSFYKVKLTNESMDQDGCVFLRPMHRYQPRLHVIPVDSDSQQAFTLDNPNVQTFTFPKTEFYAVTSYQNPQITQLKIDFNPFAMAFRKDNQSIRLLQDKLGLCSPSVPHTQQSGVNLAMYTSEQNRQVCALENPDSPCVTEPSKNGPPSGSLSNGEEILENTSTSVSTYLNGASLCKKDIDCIPHENEKQSLTSSSLDEHAAPVGVKSSASAAIQDPPQTNGPVTFLSSTESSKLVSQDAVNSTQVSQSQGRMKLKLSSISQPRPSLLSTNQVYRHDSVLWRKPFRRGRKAKSKLWSNVRYYKPHPVIAPLDISLRPDLEDVEGMLFVSFAKKEGLDIHVKNMKSVETPPSPPSPPPPPMSDTQIQSDNCENEDVVLSVEERISQLESTLLLHLKQQKHRQVIHPFLQDVGIKLSLLDPTVAIDLQYLGVRLPFPSPIHSSFDQVNPVSITASCDGTGAFVSRTGKTNDPTKIKGWRDKLNNTGQNEGGRNNSAFCSDMLDEYLENEAQQISDRVSVFAQSSSAPVSYQLPSKSSSYVVTLDSRLKTRPTPLNTVNSCHENIQIRPSLKRNQRNVVPYYFTNRLHNGTLENKRRSSNSSSDQAPTGPQARPGTKNQTGRPHERLSNGMTLNKVQMYLMLKDMEEEGLFDGKAHIQITTERARFALSSLITSQRYQKRKIISSLHHKNNGCPEKFCRLGCICDSLHRKIRGPTHCRRVECMFDCNCFKHKVLLVHPPKVTTVQQGRSKALMTFSIADPDKGNRPPPAATVTTLWKKTKEHDPESLFVPEVECPRMSTCCLGPAQIREEDKDPVYLYFESKMTCARVREYNSNPPPQLHMLPNKKLRHAVEKLGLQDCVPASFQTIAGDRTTDPAEPLKAAPTSVNPDEPEPTKLLEILSECNWEPHRNLVLSALFWRMSNNMFSEPFCIGMYKVRLLSTTLKKSERCSTVTYKVCISRSEDRTMTDDLQPKGKRTRRIPKASEVQTQKGSSVVSTNTVSKISPSIEKTSGKLPSKKLSRILPLLAHGLPAGYLKAAKKRPGDSAQGLIKVNGKIYNQAKLLLGQVGALHPANRLAAFLTGRLHPQPQDQSMVIEDTESCLAKDAVEPSAVPEVTCDKLTPSTSTRPSDIKYNAVSKKTTNPKFASLSAFSKLVVQTTHLKEDGSLKCSGPLQATTHLMSASPEFVHLPVPSSTSGTSSAETATTTSATLPPGQQVVLQHVPGPNFFCQYNGQVIHLVPVAPGPTGQSQTSLNSKATNLPKGTPAVQMPLITSLPKPSPSAVIGPRIVSLSGSSGMNIASGAPAINLQCFPGKTGIFSFRICPPSADGKSVGSQQGAKCADSISAPPSTLLLPGGFTLIKLSAGSNPGVPAVPKNVTITTPVPPPKDECMEEAISASCSSRTEQRSHTSESSTESQLLETSNSVKSGAACALNSETGAEETHVDSAGILKSESELGLKDMGVRSPKETVQIQHINNNLTDEKKTEGFNNQLISNTDISIRRSADMKAKISDISKNPHIQENCLPSQANEESSTPEARGNQKQQMKCSLPVEDKVTVPNDSTVSETNPTNKNNSEQLPLSDPSALPKQDPSNKPIQALSVSPCDISNKLQESGTSALIQTEMFKEPVQKDMVANQPSISEPHIVLETSSPVISKSEVISNVNNTVFSCLFSSSQSLGPGSRRFVNILPYPDPSETNACADYCISKQGTGPKPILPSMNKQVLASHFLSNQNCYLRQAESNSLNGMEQDDDNYDDYIDIDGEVDFPLLEGQTPAIFTLSKKSPHTASKNTEPPTLNKPSDSYHQSSRLVSHVQRERDLPQGKKLARRNNMQQFKKADQVGCVDEDCVNSIDGEQGNSCDSDSSEGSSDDDDNKNSSSDENPSSGSKSDSSNDTTDESASASCSEDDPVVMESFEENELMAVSGLNTKIEEQRKAKKAGKLKKKLNQRKDTFNRVESANKVRRRISHTEKERVRRGEMRQSFVSLKTALNIEEKMKMCKHDILIQARLMIRALEDRNRTLEERKKALLERHSAYVNMIAQLSAGRTEEMLKRSFKEKYAQGECLENQNPTLPSVPKPQINPRRLDSDGNQLPPRLGLWKSNGYTRVRSKKSPQQPPATPTGKVRKKKILREDCEQEKIPDVHNLTPASVPGPQINPQHLQSEGNQLSPHVGSDDDDDVQMGSKKSFANPPNTTTKATGQFALPKIVLQSFGKTDAGEKITSCERSLPDSSQASQSAEHTLDVTLGQHDAEAETDKDTATKISKEIKNSSVSEESNKENPCLSPPVEENCILKDTLPEFETEKTAAAGLVKVKRKRSKVDVIIKDALSNPDALGPRMLRNSSPATNRMATRSTPMKKQRII